MEEEGGGRPRRRARKAEDAAADAAAAARRPPASLTPEPRMEPALGAAAAPGAPPTRYGPGPRRAPGGRERTLAAAAGGARARWETPLRSRTVAAGGAGGGVGTAARWAQEGLPGRVAGERRDHPSPPRPHSARAANLRRARRPRGARLPAAAERTRGLPGAHRPTACQARGC